MTVGTNKINKVLTVVTKTVLWSIKLTSSPHLKMISTGSLIPNERFQISKGGLRALSLGERTGDLMYIAQ